MPAVRLDLGGLARVGMDPVGIDDLAAVDVQDAAVIGAEVELVPALLLDLEEAFKPDARSSIPAWRRSGRGRG